MTEFTIHLANRPGMLAALTEQLAEAGVTIEALAAYGIDGEGVVRLMVNDPTLTRKILSRDNIAWSEHTVITTTLGHDPGALAELARRLADANVNIDAMYLLRSSAEGMEFAVAVDDMEPARNSLAV